MGLAVCVLLHLLGTARGAHQDIFHKDHLASLVGSIVFAPEAREEDPPGDIPPGLLVPVERLTRGVDEGISKETRYLDYTAVNKMWFPCAYGLDVVILQDMTAQTGWTHKSVPSILPDILHRLQLQHPFTKIALLGYSDKATAPFGDPAVPCLQLFSSITNDLDVLRSAGEEMMRQPEPLKGDTKTNLYDVLAAMVLNKQIGLREYRAQELTPYNAEKVDAVGGHIFVVFTDACPHEGPELASVADDPSQIHPFPAEDGFDMNTICESNIEYVDVRLHA